jgi:hypothetical protein
MEENRYLKWDFFQGILLFVINCLWSFHENARRVFLYLLHSNDHHENIAIVYPPLKIVHACPHCITDFLFGPCDDHNQVDEPHEAKADISPPVLALTSSKTQHRYTPLKLPQVLQDFPPKYYEYLPVFDGEPNGISTENHIQGFEHFVDLFEIDHDDVCMRAFSQSLKEDTKEWFKHLYP